MIMKATLMFPLLAPVAAMADEPSNSTVIMISGVGCWLMLSSGLILWKQIKLNKNHRD
jgi:hypothetical protein